MSEAHPGDRSASDANAEDTLLLGVELARARAADERRGPRSDASPLRGVDYSPPAAGLWRWVDAPADAVVSAFVTEYAGMDTAGRARLRSALDMDDLYTLVTFARRRALAALRSGDGAEALAGLDALAAIELDRIDWRDVWVAAALASYAAERAGLDPADAVIGAAGRAEPETGDLLTEVATDSIDLGEECGYREIDTSAGQVLVDDEGEHYAPESDLVGLAISAAAVLEGENYRVEDVTVAVELPDAWLGGGSAATRLALHRMSGCALVHAEPRGDGGPDANEHQHFLLVYLAEAANAEDAATIAGAAGCDAPQGAVELGVSSGRHCAVVVARSAVTGVPAIEDEKSLARFSRPLAALLPG